MPRPKILDRRPIPNGYVSPGNSPFLKKLPREVRDKIYNELFIVHMTQDDWGKYEQVINEDRASEYERECAFDHFDREYTLMPNVKIDNKNNKGTQYIAQSMGLLLANKQIYEEATTVLFSKNLWGVFLESERIWSFWRCDSYTCEPTDRPCYVRPETAAKIKHLSVIVNVRNDDKVPAGQEAHNLKQNLYIMVDTLKGVDLKLQTLKVRYWTQYNGEVEAMREALEGPLPQGIPDRPIMMKNFTTGRYHQIRRSEINTKLFRDIKILEPLRGFKGVAQEVSVRGDLPQAYKDELTRVLTSANSTRITKKKQQEQAKAVKKSKAPSNASSSLAEFARDMLAENPNADAGTQDLHRQLMRTSVKSPAVMAEIFRQPTKEEIDRISAQCRADRAAQAADVEEEATTESEGEGEAQALLGGIGVIAGKPVFGPPRPPGMV